MPNQRANYVKVIFMKIHILWSVENLNIQNIFCFEHKFTWICTYTLIYLYVHISLFFFRLIYFFLCSYECSRILLLKTFTIAPLQRPILQEYDHHFKSNEHNKRCFHLNLTFEIWFGEALDSRRRFTIWLCPCWAA